MNQPCDQTRLCPFLLNASEPSEPLGHGARNKPVFSLSPAFLVETSQAYDLEPRQPPGVEMSCKARLDALLDFSIPCLERSTAQQKTRFCNLMDESPARFWIKYGMGRIDMDATEELLPYLNLLLSLQVWLDGTSRYDGVPTGAFDAHIKAGAVKELIKSTLGSALGFDVQAKQVIVSCVYIDMAFSDRCYNQTR